jgi:hypothetical protein
MAVDTAQKRFSMLNFGDGTTIHLLFEQDGAVDLDDRQHLLDCYSGIAFGSPAGVTIMSQLRATHRRIHSRVFGRVN